MAEEPFLNPAEGNLLNQVLQEETLEEEEEVPGRLEEEEEVPGRLEEEEEVPRRLHPRRLVEKDNNDD
jgi:hypothetical protein